MPTLGKIARDRLFRLAALALAVLSTPRAWAATEGDPVLKRAATFLGFIKGEAS
ncbi:hypothetical protein ACETK8_15725 [Brevundimonas staleyi]|uniref:Uncharacterized protein n=1 Tax=Brevundimonas staleyi TaxID=74326 RepID=A0ABW0FWZ7_9CAUL